MSVTIGVLSSFLVLPTLLSVKNTFQLRLDLIAVDITPLMQLTVSLKPSYLHVGICIMAQSEC
jgi:hypothetical protein